MKSMVRHINNNGVLYEALMFVCPGCAVGGPGRPSNSGLHILPVNTTEHSPSWDWDGNLELPTISPSILTGKGSTTFVCHSFLKNGVFDFLTDSTHSLSGQQVSIPDLPDWVVNEEA